MAAWGRLRRRLSGPFPPHQVELWFGKIERDIVARGVFASVAGLKLKLVRDIQQYNQAPRGVTV
jgi:hypothetical protein